MQSKNKDDSTKFPTRYELYCIAKGYIRERSRSKIFPITKNCKQDNVIPTLTSRYYGAQANGAYLREISPKEVNNPLKGKIDYGWHFEQNVYSKESLCRSLKSTEGSGNKPKIIEEDNYIYSRPHGFNKGGVKNLPNVRLSMNQNEFLNCIRRLTPKECERLQGFPDNYTSGISDSQRYKCLGNAVTVNVIREIIEQMKLAI